MPASLHIPKTRWLAVLSILALAIALHAPILRGVAGFLIVEDSLRPAAAIVALGGQTPFREMEAARFYRSGLATQVIIVREAPSEETETLRKLNVEKAQGWEIAREVLINQGVPPSAIVVPKEDAVGTLEELQAVYKALVSQRSEVGDQRSAIRFLACAANLLL